MNLDVRNGSKVDSLHSVNYVRFAPENGHLDHLPALQAKVPLADICRGQSMQAVRV